MKLIKFKIKSVTESITDEKSYSFGDWGQKHPHHYKRFFYEIFDDEDKKYILSECKFQKIYPNQTIMCFSRENENSNFIENHSLYGRLMTPKIFEKARQDYLARAKRDIEFWQKEIERLDSLI